MLPNSFQPTLAKFKPFFRPTAAVILSGTFFISAILKALFWSDTTFAIESLVLRRELSLMVTVLLIAMELVLSQLLLQPKYWELTAFFSIATLILFSAVVFWGKSQGLITECPCFGKLFGARIGVTLAIRNLLLLGCGIVLALRQLSHAPLDESLFLTLGKFNYVLGILNALLVGRLLGSLIV